MNDMAPASSLPNSFTEAERLAEETIRRMARGDIPGIRTPENQRGVALALASSIFIGASFIIKKKGLMAAGQKGVSARDGGYSYLRQPLWWVGMGTMIGGEFANLAAYAYAPAIVVTPLGASTIIISAILATIFLGEQLHVCGVFACFLTVLGSAILVGFAPAEAPLTSVEEIWQLATQPQFLVYCCCVVALALLLIYRFAPRYGRTHLLVYVLICSLIGSLSVVSCKALGIALKLTLRGNNQLFKRETFAFTCTVLVCVLIQMNYLNKVSERGKACSIVQHTQHIAACSSSTAAHGSHASSTHASSSSAPLTRTPPQALDTFNTALVSSTYYVFFTTCTIAASMIM